MGVIVKYLIDFKGAGFKVSNDMLQGDFIIDVSVKASMQRGAAGSQFEIKLYDLPEEKAGLLYKKAGSAKVATVEIKLGYMDGEFSTVMEGIYTDVTTKIEGDSVVTTVIGDESGTYALKHTRFQKGLEGNIKFEDAIAKLLEDAPFESAVPSSLSGIEAALASALGNAPSGSDLIDKTPRVENIPDDVKDICMKGENLMMILDKLVTNANAEFLVCDKKIHMGKPITNDQDYMPDEFDRDINLAQFRPMAKNLPGEEGDNRLIKLKPHQVLGFKFIITGDPRLRPAQKVSANVKIKAGDEVLSYRKEGKIEFRVHSIVHSLSMTGGYICEGTATKICDDENCRRQQDAIGLGNPDRVVQRLSQQTKDERRKNPSIEIGAVKQYNSGEAENLPHRSTLYFGQRFANTETQPSIRAEVATEENHLLCNKPIVSPFAWHKCGLVVPVYSGMKAVLTHNLNLSDDALVTGFLWSDKPEIAPPKNKEGDWWLCLPIDFDSSKPPSDDTKAANDLIANNGKRVIEVNGLKITVGTDKLSSVGTRPKEGEDNEFLIEHKKAKIKIAADGTIEMTADKEGGIVFKISKTSVDIS